MLIVKVILGKKVGRGFAAQGKPREHPPAGTEFGVINFGSQFHKHLSRGRETKCGGKQPG
jgi:hypothetical protein